MIVSDSAVSGLVLESAAAVEIRLANQSRNPCRRVGDTGRNWDDRRTYALLADKVADVEISARRRRDQAER